MKADNHNPGQLSALIESIGESAKYRQIDASIVARIGAAELAKGRKLNEAVKAAKNKLHQIGGAYLVSAPNYDAWLDELAAVAENPAELKAACRRMMAQHASTRERLPILDEFYSTVFSQLPPVHSVLDLACGFNPLALPWMPLSEDVLYYACDIYYDMLFFVGKFFEIMEVESQVQVCDLAGEFTPPPVDLALALKTIPCLEQIEKDAGGRLLDRINAKHILVSFPVHSLGGKAKGMRQNYEERFEQLAHGKDWGITRFEFETELAFLIET